jgi:hypothetical protein
MWLTDSDCSEAPANNYPMPSTRTKIEMAQETTVSEMSERFGASDDQVKYVIKSR